jgi:hypothetical protein
MNRLYRITCGVDAVVAADTPEDAHAFAAAEKHHVRVEPLEEPEVLVALDGEEATLALAAISHTIAAGPSDPNTNLLARLRERIAEALAVIDEQHRLRAG